MDEKQALKKSIEKQQPLEHLANQLGVNSTSFDFDWIITDNLLQSLEPELRKTAIAVSIPHWFNPEMIKALCPKLKSNSNDLYRKLQDLPFAEPFGERGYNIHELTRNQILNWLWGNKRSEFILLSKRAAEYFDDRNKHLKISRFVQKTEHYYHLAIDDAQTETIQSFCEDLDNNSEYEKLDFLIHALFELTTTDRLPEKLRSDILHWKETIKEYIKQENKIAKRKSLDINHQKLQEIAGEEPRQINKFMFE